MNDKDTFIERKIFSYFSFFWITLGFLVFLLALSGFFYISIVFSFVFLGLASLGYSFFKKKLYRNISQRFVALNIAILLFIVTISYYSSPTIFSGRDQGSMAEAAIRLSQNHRLKFSTPASEEFFRIYEKDYLSKECGANNLSLATGVACHLKTARALNFPGFHYAPDGKLITQFPIPYISFIAVFYSAFGLMGFSIANAVLFYIFILSFYFTVQIISGKKNNRVAYLSVIFAMTSFLLSWIMKFTLSENMAMAVLWFGIFQLVSFFSDYSENEDDSMHSLIMALLSLSFLSFIRIEGIAILLLTIVISLIHPKTRKAILKFKSILVLPSIFFFIFIFTSNLIINSAFFQEMLSATIKASGGISQIKKIPLDIFYLYGISNFLILGTLGIFYYIRKKVQLALIPFVIVLPTFIYLINPQISYDHPWMLRRFSFSVLPALILYSSLILFEIKKKRKIATYILISILLVFNTSIFFYYIDFSENSGLIKQTEEISKNFQKDDLILVDQGSSGDKWSMLSGPLNFLFEKNSVYFFNPNDFDRIEKNRFQNIYLIVSEFDTEKYLNSPMAQIMQEYKSYSIQTTALRSSASDSLPDEAITHTKGKIFKLTK